MPIGAPNVSKDRDDRDTYRIRKEFISEEGKTYLVRPAGVYADWTKSTQHLPGPAGVKCPKKVPKKVRTFPLSWLAELQQLSHDGQLQEAWFFSLYFSMSGVNFPHDYKSRKQVIGLFQGHCGLSHYGLHQKSFADILDGITVI